MTTGRSRSRSADPGAAFDVRMAAYMRQLRDESFHRRSLFRLAAGSAGAAALLTALGGPAEAASKRIAPGVWLLRQDATSVTVGLEGDVRGLEPALSYDFTANPVVCEISEGLLAFDAAGNLIPMLAETWEQVDELTYTYTLRQGVTFSDGSPVTVDDVLASIARVRDPEVAGPLAWMYDTPGATAEAVDDMTVKITLATPSALFRYVVATTAGHVIPKAQIEKFGLDLLANPMGTGPYMLTAWDAGSQIALERNPNYWQEGKPYFDTMIFKIVEEGTTRVTGLKNGELGIVTSVPPDQVDIVKGFENVAYKDVVGYTINGLVMRTDQPPFDDVNIRKAVCHAIDLQAIMDSLVKDTGVLSRNTAVPPDMPGSAAGVLEPVPFDLAKAKELMAASSMPDGFKTELAVIAPNDIWVPQAIAVQEALKELNIEVEVVQMPYADMITLQQSGEFTGLMSFQWGSDFPDAAGNLIPLFLSTNIPPQNNHAFYNNPEVDKLLNDAEKELDQEKRKQMLIDAQKLISDDQPWIFFEHFKWAMPMNKDLTGYSVSALWYWDCIGRDLKPAGA
ncbi:MAG: ABC transporter substrate-binding protein [Chloroflexota bacterium]